MRKIAIIMALLAAPALLGACGLQGDLKTPPPLWGEDERSEKDIADGKPAPREASRASDSASESGN